MTQDNSDISFTTLNGAIVPLSGVYALQAAYRNPATEEVFLNPSALFNRDAIGAWLPRDQCKYIQDIKNYAKEPWVLLRGPDNGQRYGRYNEIVIRARAIETVDAQSAEIGGCPIHAVTLKDLPDAKGMLSVYACYQPGPYQAHEAVQRYSDIGQFCAQHHINFG